MFKAKLISADISANYLDPGDRLYVTAKFENVGDCSLNKDAFIAADVIFCGRHRREQNQNCEFRFMWKPFPDMAVWKSGEVWSTTGAWTVAPTWGATFEVRLSVVTKSGEIIPIIGANETETFAQKIGEIDIAWGWGRKRLLEQRRALHTEFNEISPAVGIIPQNQTDLGYFKIGADYPQIMGYGEEKWPDIAPLVTIRDIKNNTQRLISMTEFDSRLAALSDSAAEYSFKNEYVSARLSLEDRAEKLSVSLKSVKAEEGYEFIKLSVPLAFSCSDDAVLTNFFGGGRKFALKDAMPQSVTFVYDTCNIISAGDSGLTFCLDAADADSMLTQSVITAANGKKYAVLTAGFMANYPADEKGMKSIPVEPVEIDLYAVSNADWKTPARIIQKKLPKNPKQTYKDTFVYKLDTDDNAQYNPENPITYKSKYVHTLKDAQAYVKKIADLTDDMKQVLYIVGWQSGGHDFEYPYPYLAPFNPRVGTEEEFLSLQKELKGRNCSLSFHDNFDDAYLSDNYELTDDMMAFDEHGEFYKGWLWAGGMSYILAPEKYLKSGKAVERIEKTLDRFNIKEVGTYHLDVMSSENRRYDFYQNNPTNAQQNYLAKREIIKEFNKRGVDVTSETLTLQYADLLGFCQGFRNIKKGELFAGDEFVPMTTLAMHGAQPYCASCDNDDVMLSCMVSGGTDPGCRYDDNDEGIVEKLYLFTFPMLKFSYEKVKDIDYSEQKSFVDYGGGSYIKVDNAEKTYEISYKGKIIASDYSTAVECGGKYYAYSRNGKELEIDLPSDWTKVTVTELPAKDKESIKTVDVKNGVLKLKAEPKQPYVIKKV